MQAPSLLLPTHEGLRAGSRLETLTSDRLRVADMLWLIGMGVLAALPTALLDIAALWSRRGWQIYFSFALAAMLSNLGAFAVRYATKAAALGVAVEGAGSR